MKNTPIFSTHFCGKKISDYGLEHGRVDYRTLASAFDAVLCNNIFSVVDDLEPVQSGEYYLDSNGNYYDYDEAQERIEELEEERETLSDECGSLEIDFVDSDEDLPDKYYENLDRMHEIDSDLEELEDVHYSDVCQWFIISDNGAELLQDYTDEVLYYSDSLDCYVWGVTHWGTSWDYVLTNIPCNPNSEA